MSYHTLKDDLDRAESTLNAIYIKAAQEKINLGDPKIHNTVKRLENYIAEIQSILKLHPKGRQKQ